MPESLSNHPFFSVIIPTYNRCDFLRLAADSVLRQSFRDFELLVIDDGSTDATPDFIKTLKDFRLHYIYQKHRGVSYARNTGIKLARGNFIAFLDSDDRYRHDKLEISFKFIKKYPRKKIFHTEEIWYSNGKILSPKKYHKKPLGNVFAPALKLCCLSLSTVVIDKKVFSDIGYFDENLPACEDYDLWLRAASKYPVCLIPEYLTIKEGGRNDQLSKRYPAMDKFRIYALKKIIENGRLNNRQLTLAAGELEKKCNIYLKGALKRNKTKKARTCRQIIHSLKYTYGFKA